MNENIKIWIDEIKQIEKVHEIQKKQLIQFDNYFKYSGGVEEYKKEQKWEKNKAKAIKVNSSDPIIKFYFKNPNYTINEIGDVFKCSGSRVRTIISNYLSNNNKKIKNGKNTKNERCK